MKNIFISSDHAGYTLKEYIKKSFIKKKIKLFDLGPNSNNSVDYPLYAHKLSKKVSKSSKNVGILVCGSGTGMSITANKHKKIRAARCDSLRPPFLSFIDTAATDISSLSLYKSKKNALLFINTFLKTKFDSGRHQKRINKI